MTVAFTPIGIRIVTGDVGRMLSRLGKVDPDVAIPMAYKLLSYKEPLPKKEKIRFDLQDTVICIRMKQKQLAMFALAEARSIVEYVMKEDEA